MKKIWLKMVGDKEQFNKLTNEEIEGLSEAEYSEYMKARFKDLEDQIVKLVEEKGADGAAEILKLRTEMTDTNLKMTNALKEQGTALAKLTLGHGPDSASMEKQVLDFVTKNQKDLEKIYRSGNGVLEFEVKVVGDITVGSGTIPVAAPDVTGVQQAPISNINLRGTFVNQLTTNITTSLAAFSYSDAIPKEGAVAYIAEGGTKPQIDFRWETRFASPVKAAAWIRLTEESVQDVAGLQSIATDFLRKKHDLKKQEGILFGDGISPNPLGATVIGRTFVAGAMATKVATPTIMDVINACITDIFTTHNYVDEEAYFANLVILNPVDFYLEFVAPKTLDGLPLFPTASLFNSVNIGGVTVIPARDIPAGQIFVSDMSKYNTTNYKPYVVKMGWINDDFIKNQFVMLGESRFHAFVKELDKQAFIFDTIATVKAAILKP